MLSLLVFLDMLLLRRRRPWLVDIKRKHGWRGLVKECWRLSTHQEFRALTRDGMRRCWARTFNKFKEVWK